MIVFFKLLITSVDTESGVCSKRNELFSEMNYDFFSGGKFSKSCSELMDYYCFCLFSCERKLIPEMSEDYTTSYRDIVA